MFGSPLEGGFGEFAVAKAIVPGQRPVLATTLRLNMMTIMFDLKHDECHA
jgi:hypothetical protein